MKNNKQKCKTKQKFENKKQKIKGEKQKIKNQT